MLLSREFAKRSHCLRTLDRMAARATRFHDHGMLQGLSPDHLTTCHLQESVEWCETRTLKPTAYTGSAGLALALWRAGMLHQRSDWCERASWLASAALTSITQRPGYYVPESLLDGCAGVVLVNCLVAAGGGQPGMTSGPAEQHSSQVQQLLASYTDICRAAAGRSADSDEFLYGRAGTLFGALLLKQQLGPAAVPDAVVCALLQAILASGRSLASRLPVFQASRCPLAYVWPPGPSAEPYLGAAHGLMGILYVLLHCSQWLQQDQQAMQDIRDCLSFVRRCECDVPGSPAGSGGHYPALMQLQGLAAPEHSVLVHWCHGAPGAVYLWTKAYEVLGDTSYLQAALRAGEVVWERGLLRKGPGLCHGVSGNAYALLRLWKTTQDPMWLQRGQLFAAFMVSSTGKADWHSPDHPTSLYEGAAGGICLLAELLAVQDAAAQDRPNAAAAAAPAAADTGGAAANSSASAQAAAGLVAFPMFELW